MKSRSPKIVGLIPAAGNASRIAPIPCSKEIFPIGFQENPDQPAVKVAVSYLLDSFVEAGTEQIYLIMRKGKWDIPQYLGVGAHVYTLAYIITDPTAGTHYTIDLAYRFIKDKIVLLGFPDILFKPKNAYCILLAQQEKTGADVVLGLFAASNPHKGDMVELDEQKRVIKIDIKPEHTSLKNAWAIAIWNPVFTNYLHASLRRKTRIQALKVTKSYLLVMLYNRLLMMACR